MFDHVAIAVSDLWESKRFYRTVLGALGMEPSYVDDVAMGWDDWWIGSTDDLHPLTRGLHVGFRARDGDQVDEFWWTAVDSGYREEDPPGPRTQYDPTYYSAFLLDPDGNSVQAVYRDREPGRANRLHRSPLDPRPRRAGLNGLLRDHRPADRSAPDAP